MTGVVSGKVALITGASGGFGSHFARVLARQGAHVALAARRINVVETLRQEIEGEGGTAFALSMDVAKEASIVDGIAAIEADFGPVDIVVNNAGISGVKPALESSAEDWDSVIDTNLRGAFLVAREAGRAMRNGGRTGSIINIASIVGLRPAAALSAYAASKAGLIHLTHSLAMELARYGIRVNAIAPGYYPTDMNAGYWDTDAGQAMIKRIPMRRLGELEDLDGPLLLLASDAGAYMTGAVIPVDGGHLCSPL